MAGHIKSIAYQEEACLAGGAKLGIGACGAILRTVDAADVAVVVLVRGAI